MTRIVYAAPDIPPDVWTPPRGVTVLPLHEHPAIVAESVIERLPGDRTRSIKRLRETQTIMLLRYFRENPPGDIYTIAGALGLNWQSAKRKLLANPHLFRKVGRVQVYKVYRALWGLVEA